MNRSSEYCKDRVLNYGEFQNNTMINYYQWCTTVEKYICKSKEKKKIVSNKTTRFDSGYYKKIRKFHSRLFCSLRQRHAAIQYHENDKINHKSCRSSCTC